MWEELPPRAQAIARKIGPMVCDGYSLAEIGRSFGKSEDWASTRVAELRNAILDQIRAGAARQEHEIRELRRLLESRGGTA